MLLVSDDSHILKAALQISFMLVVNSWCLVALKSFSTLLWVTTILNPLFSYEVEPRVIGMELAV